MLGLKLNHVSKRGYWYSDDQAQVSYIKMTRSWQIQFDIEIWFWIKSLVLWLYLATTALNPLLDIKLSPWQPFLFNLHTFLSNTNYMNISSHFIIWISTHFYMSAGISYELSYKAVSSHLSPPSCPITDGENKEGNIMTYTGGAVRRNLLFMGNMVIYTRGISRDLHC